jgi:hypothetical protein
MAQPGWRSDYGQWARQDSNLGPTDYESAALTMLSYGPCEELYGETSGRSPPQPPTVSEPASNLRNGSQSGCCPPIPAGWGGASRPGAAG